jgi:hemerythrin superfamily protein
VTEKTGSPPHERDNVLPARGKDTIEILRHDHVVIKQLLSELTGARQRSERVAAFERLKGVLTIHNATEESLVYPALSVVAHKKRESEHLYHETAEADMLVFELDSLLKAENDHDVSAKAKQLQAAIFEHIDDEETRAFPTLQSEADAAHAETLTQSVRAFRRSIHFEPTPV